MSNNKKKKEDILDRFDRRLDYLTLILTMLTPISIILLLINFIK